MNEQRSLLEALEPINPHGFVDRIPGIDAPCPISARPCSWPWCLCFAKQSDQEEQ
jgi:hypothetical protein